jgi:hypothetical protein
MLTRKGAAASMAACTRRVPMVSRFGEYASDADRVLTSLRMLTILMSAEANQNTVVDRASGGGVLTIRMRARNLGFRLCSLPCGPSLAVLADVEPFSVPWSAQGFEGAIEVDKVESGTDRSRLSPHSVG